MTNTLNYSPTHTTGPLFSTAVFAAVLALIMVLGACSGGIKSSQAIGTNEAETPALAAEQRRIDVGGRASEVWVWQATTELKGNILFSHGAQSAPWKYQQLVAFWLAAGYSVYAPLHVDSSDHPLTGDFAGMTSWAARLEDMLALRSHLGDKPYVAAGHSYGALVALNLGGASQSLPEDLSPRLHERPPSLVLAFSPPGEIPGFVSEQGYASLAVPALVQTGLLDIPIGGDASWEVHLAPFKAAAAGGNRYALVQEGVDHYYGGSICRPELPGPKQTMELEAAAKLSVQMMQAFHEKSPSALERLNSQLNDPGKPASKVGLTMK